MNFKKKPRRNRKLGKILLHLGPELKFENWNNLLMSMVQILLEFLKIWVKQEIKLKESSKLWKRRSIILVLGQAA